MRRLNGLSRWMLRNLKAALMMPFIFVLISTIAWALFFFWCVLLSYTLILEGWRRIFGPKRPEVLFRDLTGNP